MLVFFFPGAALYRKLQTYLMTEEQLQEHGYPRKHPDASGKAIVYNLPEKKAPVDRTYLRNKTRIFLTATGLYIDQ